MRPRRSWFLVAPFILLATVGTTGSVRAAVCDGSSDSLGNGGFETPVVDPGTFRLFPEASVPPWHTTDLQGEIEIWGTGSLQVPAAEGNAFAELNANSPGTLYQDVISTPGATMTWTLQHRGRRGDDTMQVLIGDANAANVNGNDGWDVISDDLTDGTDAWGTHTGDFVVPAGQTCTRFAFRAVTAAGGDSIGNFLDAVAFTVTIPAEPTDPDEPGPTKRVTPPPTDTPGCAVCRQWPEGTRRRDRHRDAGRRHEPWRARPSNTPTLPRRRLTADGECRPRAASRPVDACLPASATVCRECPGDGARSPLDCRVSAG